MAPAYAKRVVQGSKPIGPGLRVSMNYGNIPNCGGSVVSPLFLAVAVHGADEAAISVVSLRLNRVAASASADPLSPRHVRLRNSAALSNHLPGKIRPGLKLDS